MKKANTDEIFQQAYAEHNNSKLSEAAEGYRKVLSVEPENANALHLLGLIEFDWNNIDAAIPLVEKSLELAPNELQWLLNYGTILAKAGIDGSPDNPKLNKKRYRKLVMIWHPDRGAGNAENFTQLGNAVDALKNKSPPEMGGGYRTKRRRRRNRKRRGKKTTRVRRGRRRRKKTKRRRKRRKTKRRR